MRTIALYLLGTAILLTLLGTINVLFGSLRVERYRELLVRNTHDIRTISLYEQSNSVSASIDDIQGEKEALPWFINDNYKNQEGEAIKLFRQKIEFYSLVENGGRMMLVAACALLLVVLLIFGMTREQSSNHGE